MKPGPRTELDFIEYELRRLLGEQLLSSRIRRVAEARHLLARVSAVSEFEFRSSWSYDSPQDLSDALRIFGRHVDARDLHLILGQDPYGVVILPAAVFFRSPLSFAALNRERIELATPDAGEGLKLWAQGDSIRPRWYIDIWGPRWPKIARRTLGPRL